MSILSINKSLIKTIFSNCSKCVNKTNVCAQCENMDRYISSSFLINCDSTVILAPSLYEEYFHGGPVALFTVVAGYSAIIELINAICTPNSNYLKTNQAWIDENLEIREQANELLKGAPSIRLAFESYDKLVVIQTLESWIVYGISVMNYVSSKKQKSFDSILQLLKLSLIATSMIQWTFGSRALRDKLHEKIEINQRWNKQHEELKNDQRLKKVHEELKRKHEESNMMKFVIE